MVKARREKMRRHNVGSIGIERIKAIDKESKEMEKENGERDRKG